MLSKDLEQTLNDAFRGARAKRHEFMTVEHLLLALLDNNDAIRVLKACGADIGGLRGDLVEFVDATTPLIPEDEEDRDTQPTLGFQRVLQRAVFHVQSSGKKEVTGGNVLVAIFSEQESQAVYFLKQQNIARIDVVKSPTAGVGTGPSNSTFIPVLVRPAVNAFSNIYPDKRVSLPITTRCPLDPSLRKYRPAAAPMRSAISAVIG